MSVLSDLDYLKKAFSLAHIRRGFCSPNPSVGALIVTSDQQEIEGYHEACGALHAEVVAIQKARIPLRGATLYVTLEPCAHWGKTPPCTQAIIKSGITRVVYGYKDPNKAVIGQGAALLQAAGLECHYLPSEEITAFYESYAYWLFTQKPYITAKLALSLDGKIAGEENTPLPITGAELHQLTHLSRKKADAILTTSTTVIADNPQLTARYQEEVVPKSLYILDRLLQVPLASVLFNQAKNVTLFYSDKLISDQLPLFLERGVRCIPSPLNKADKESLDLHFIVDYIGQEGVHDLWVEAGGKCFSHLIESNLINRVYIYIALLWIGLGKSAFTSNSVWDISEANIKWVQYGNDVLCDIKWDKNKCLQV